MKEILRMQRGFLDRFDTVRHTPVDWRILDLMNYLSISRPEAWCTVTSLAEADSIVLSRYYKGEFTDWPLIPDADRFGDHGDGDWFRFEVI
jgi:hypothetical protein